jgi:inosine-uridine nucleoside N-ribohydrolase
LTITSILLDCDPGNDDALAIMVAAGNHDLHLRAVTTGAGHLASDRTARNAAIMMAKCAPVRVPVAAGAAGPLVRDRLIAGVLDLERALDPERPDLPAVDLDPRHSAELIVDVARATPGVTIVTTGPFTNLALALRHVPEIAPNIARIVSLAGAWGLGNKTAAAEWNVLCDPEAAAIVIGAGIPLTLIPIDAAAEVVIDEDLVGAASQTGGQVAEFAVELLTSLQATYRPGRFGPPGAPLNDPCAAMVAANPDLVQTVRARVDVELAGRFTYGRTVVDFAGNSGLAPNCDVVVGFDVAATRHEFLASLGGLAGRAA